MTPPVDRERALRAHLRVMDWLARKLADRYLIGGAKDSKYKGYFETTKELLALPALASEPSGEREQHRAEHAPFADIRFPRCVRCGKPWPCSEFVGDVECGCEFHGYHGHQYCDPSMCPCSRPPVRHTPAPPEVKPHAFVTARCFPALGVGLCKEYVQSGPMAAICNRPSTHPIHDGFPPVADEPAPESPREVAPLITDHEYEPRRGEEDGDPGDYCWAHVSMYGHGDCGKPRAAHAPTPKPEPGR